MKILYEDDSILVCYKEAGLPVQSRQMTKMDLESMLRNIEREKNPGEMPYLGVVHRLDQPVEGLVVFAKTAQAAASLSAQVQDGRMEKVYLAVCAPQQGAALPEHPVLLEDYLLRDPKTNSSRVAARGTKGAKKAQLEYCVLQGDCDLPEYRDLPAFRNLPEQYVPVRIRLLTGRHHQIRVQLAHAGLPIAGDRKYAPHTPGLPGHPFPALCAMQVTFSHPLSGEQMHFDAKEECALLRAPADPV